MMSAVNDYPINIASTHDECAVDVDYLINISMNT